MRTRLALAFVLASLAACSREPRSAALIFEQGPRERCQPLLARCLPAEQRGKLIDELMQAVAAPGASYVHAWKSGDVVMWDNRATMHRGRPWPAHEARLMVRTTVSATTDDGLESIRPPSQQAAE